MNIELNYIAKASAFYEVSVMFANDTTVHGTNDLHDSSHRHFTR